MTSPVRRAAINAVEKWYVAHAPYRLLVEFTDRSADERGLPPRRVYSEAIRVITEPKEETT